MVGNSGAIANVVKKLLCLLWMHCSRFDVYLICDCPISKDAVEFALCFYEFDFQKGTSSNEEKFKILIGEN